MKIVMNDDGLVRFSELKTGDVFKHLNDYYMRIEFYRSEQGCDVNAVNVVDGKTYWFNLTTLVTPINAELVIKS